MDHDDFDFEPIADMVQGVVEGLVEGGSEALAESLGKWGSRQESSSESWRARTAESHESGTLLRLALPPGSDIVPSDEELGLVYGGRIPVRCQRMLVDASYWETRGRLSVVFVVAIWCLLPVMGMAASFLSDPRWMALIPGVAAGILLVTVGALRPLWRLWRDSSDRRLRAVDGKVEEKWEARSACWVVIGSRKHQVHSRELFGVIRRGAMYRTHVSAHAELLIALERLGGDAGGYRDSARRTREVVAIGGGASST